METNSNSKARIIETAYRNNSTGEITKTGKGFAQGRNRALDNIVTYGFVDSRGEFLNRFDAYCRAMETNQFSLEFQLNNPEEGLFADDLRNFGKSPEFGTISDHLIELAALSKSLDDILA